MKVKLHHTLNYNTEEAIALNSEPEYWGHYQDDNSPIHIFYDTLLSLAESTKCKKKIAIIHETPAIYEYADINSNYKTFNPHRYLKQNPELFDFVLSPYSYIKEIVGEVKWLWLPTTDTFLKEEDFGFYEKHRLLSIISSFKTWTDGHRLRHEIINKFGTQMDIYGNGYNTILDDIGYGSKVQALGPYMFTIAVSNTKENDYFSEIVTDACLVGTIPIFWGTSNIGKYMNEEGILSFDTLDDLGIILKSLSKELYNSKIKAIEDNMNRAKSFNRGLDWVYLNYQKEVFSI